MNTPRMTLAIAAIATMGMITAAQPMPAGKGARRRTDRRVGRRRHLALDRVRVLLDESLHEMGWRSHLPRVDAEEGLRTADQRQQGAAQDVASNQETSLIGRRDTRFYRESIGASATPTKHRSGPDTRRLR